MGYGLLADLVVGLHFAFVLFVAAGGLLVLRWTKVAWAHLPAAAWGVIIEWAGWVCPLTPLENWLRAQADEPAYATGFVERYLIAVLYPEALTRTMQIALGAFALGVNVMIYALVWRRVQVSRGRRTADL